MMMELTVGVLILILHISMCVFYIKQLPEDVRSFKKRPSVWTRLSMALDLCIIGMSVYGIYKASNEIIQILKDVFLIIESY